MERLSRRRFIAGTAGAGALLATGTWKAGATTAALPAPNASGIEHIVVMVMENRSFDHFLGWLPGADGRQAGLRFADDHGGVHATHHLTDWSGCGFADPDHSYQGGRTQFAGGRLDGFRKGANDDFALGYYESADLPTTTKLVERFTTCDRWFCSILGPTYPNRFYTHAATTDRIDNTTDVSSLPTIWDRLAAAGVSANYYFSDLPVLGLWGAKYVPIARPIDTFLAQAATGTLPAYSYIDPSFIGEDQGGSNDDHPHADIRRGQSLVATIVNAVLQSPAWDKTVMVLTYDEWGGFFDHVRPPRRPDLAPLVIGGTPYDRTQVGFRVPAFLISPFARPGAVSHTHFDHASILRMVEWRFGLKPLQPRDAVVNNAAMALDFGYRNPTTSVPSVPDPGPHICGVPGAGAPASTSSASSSAPACTAGMTNSEPIWENLRASLDPAWRAVL